MSFFKRFRSKLPYALQRLTVWDKPSRESQQKLAFDQQLVWRQQKKNTIPSLRQLRYISGFFSARERFAIGLAGLAFVSALILAGLFVYGRFVTVVPTAGGLYREGMVGAPVYVNPVLASTNDVDLDLVHLIFSGLLRFDSDLALQPDLARHWERSEDGKTYTVTLRDEIIWHDGEPLTADDVVFTYRLMQDASVNSPLRLSMQNVSVRKLNDRTVEFTLEEPFFPFASLLTVGILPRHVWANIPAQNIRLAEGNIKPIGSGPWKFEKLEKDRQGTIHSYTLKAFARTHAPAPYLRELTFRFYPDFGSAVEALNNRKIDGISFLPRQLVSSVVNPQNYQTFHLPLPQYTAIFFQPSRHTALKEKKVRQALHESIDRRRLLEDALNNFGQIISGPILAGMPGHAPHIQPDYNPIRAQTLLTEAGWETMTAEEYVARERERLQKEREQGTNVVNEPDIIETGGQTVFRKKGNDILELTLTTVDQPEHARAAEMVANAWRAIGIKVRLEILPVNVFLTSVLPGRDYEALLYGQILNPLPDLYTFWHSSQVEYPGLNLSAYADKKTDELLQSARTTADADKQAQDFAAIENALRDELPALFLYSPKYTYILPKYIQGYDVRRIGIPADRWNNIEEWYIKTKRVFNR